MGFFSFKVNLLYSICPQDERIKYLDFVFVSLNIISFIISACIFLLILYLIVRLEKEYLSTRRQLGGEIEEKKTVIGSLSKELEVHQKNFNELKTELGKVRKNVVFCR